MFVYCFRDVLDLICFISIGYKFYFWNIVISLISSIQLSLIKNSLCVSVCLSLSLILCLSSILPLSLPLFHFFPFPSLSPRLISSYLSSICPLICHLDFCESKQYFRYLVRVCVCGGGGGGLFAWIQSLGKIIYIVVDYQKILFDRKFRFLSFASSLVYYFVCPLATN